MTSYTADEVLNRNVVNAINIFDVHGVTFKVKEPSNNFSIEKGNFLKFYISGLYIIYVNIDFINSTSTNENLLLKYKYKTKNNISKELTQDLLQCPFKLLLDIIPNDLLSFSIIRLQIGRGD